MKEVMGIINDTCDAYKLKELVDHRSMAAIPFAGRYRLIDFSLSNMVNSGIRNVGVFTQKKNRSLLEHLSGGQDWDLSGKRDGLFILPPMFEQADNYKRLGNVDFYHKHRDYILFSRQEYVLLSQSNCIYNFDLQDVNESYFKNCADIVMVYREEERYDYQMHTVLDMETITDRVKEIVVKPSKRMGNKIFCNILFMRKELFLDIIDYCVSRGYNDLIKDGIIPAIGRIKVIGHRYQGFYGEVNDPLSYYSLNKKLLNPENMKLLFNADNPILTRVQNEPPARYCSEATTSNSLIANGCVIEGTVENSILFRGVKVKEGALVKDSIVMQKGVIGENSKVVNTILDKNIKVSPGTSIISPIKYPLVVERRSKI